MHFYASNTYNNRCYYCSSGQLRSTVLLVWYNMKFRCKAALNANLTQLHSSSDTYHEGIPLESMDVILSQASTAILASLPRWFLFPVLQH